MTTTDNVPGSPQVVLLNGTGLTPDFNITSEAASETVVAGQSASFTVDISSISGFAQSVSLSCGGAPAASVCSVSPTEDSNALPRLRRSSSELFGPVPAT